MTDAPDSAPRDGSSTASPGEAPTPSPTPTPPPRSFARRHWGKLTILAFVGAPTIVLGIWTAIGLNVAYSDGVRAGFVQKISHQGWLCKTWEGELAIPTIPGSLPVLWNFSVRSDSVAAAIQRANGQRVVLTYEEKPWIPTTCFGETKYFVTEVRVAGSASEPM